MKQSQYTYQKPITDEQLDADKCVYGAFNGHEVNVMTAFGLLPSKTLAVAMFYLF